MGPLADWDNGSASLSCDRASRRNTRFPRTHRSGMDIASPEPCRAGLHVRSRNVSGVERLDAMLGSGYFRGTGVLSLKSVTITYFLLCSGDGAPDSAATSD